MEDFVCFRLGETFHIGKAFGKSLEKWDDRGGDRLLQHHFADPDAVRIAGFPPWKIPLVGVKPFQEQGY